MLESPFHGVKRLDLLLNVSDFCLSSLADIRACHIRTEPKGEKLVHLGQRKSQGLSLLYEPQAVNRCRRECSVAGIGSRRSRQKPTPFVVAYGVDFDTGLLCQRSHGHRANCSLHVFRLHPGPWSRVKVNLRPWNRIRLPPVPIKASRQDRIYALGPK
jgi:hypothetical protein